MLHAAKLICFAILSRILIPNPDPDPQICLGQSPYWSSDMFQLFTNVGISVIFLLQYSPDYNPLKMIIAEYKTVLKVWVQDRSVRWVIR
jgi:hypothetical protein